MIDQFLSALPTLPREIGEEFAEMKTVMKAYPV
jgi:hypothetical protein